MSAEEVERYRQRASEHRAHAATCGDGTEMKAASELADKYDAVAEAFEKLLQLKGPRSAGR